MNSEAIRPISICVIRRGGDIFVFEGRDTIKGETFYRPLGGAIEFGELSEIAVRRELREELSAELANLRQIGVLQNLFTHEGRRWHEIVFVFEADFADSTLYARDTATCTEDNGAQFPALWKPVTEFSGGKAILYPNGLLALITRNSNSAMNTASEGIDAAGNGFGKLGSERGMDS